MLAEDVGDGVVPEHLDLRVGERPVLHDLAGPQLVAAVDERDLLGELGEEDRLLHRRVATADDGDVMAAEEEPVAGGAGRQAVSEQLRLGLEAEHQRLGAGGHDDRVGDVLGLVDPDPERSLGEVDAGDLLVRNSAPKRDAWARKSAISSGPMMPSGKPGIVLDVGGEHQLPTGLIGRRRRLALDHERVEVGAGGVDRGGQPGGAGPDDDHVADVGIWDVVGHRGVSELHSG